MDLDEFTIEDKKTNPTTINRSITVGLQKKISTLEEIYKKYYDKTEKNFNKTETKLKSVEDLILKQIERQDKLELKMFYIENKIDFLIQFVQNKFDTPPNNFQISANNQQQYNLSQQPVFQNNLSYIPQSSSLVNLQQFNSNTSNQYTNIPQNMSIYKKEKNSSDQLNECLKDIPSPHLIKRTSSFSNQQINESKNNDIKNFISDIKNDRKVDKQINISEVEQMNYCNDTEKIIPHLKNSKRREQKDQEQKFKDQEQKFKDQEQRFKDQEQRFKDQEQKFKEPEKKHKDEEKSKVFNYTFKEVRSERFDSIDNNFIKNCLNLNSIEGEILLFKKMYIDGIPKEYYPIRHIKKKFQYWFEGHMKDDNGTYLIDTIIKNIEQLYFKINIDYDENPDQLIKNQEYIFTLSEQKYKDKFLTKIINIIDN